MKITRTKETQFVKERRLARDVYLKELENDKDFDKKWRRIGYVLERRRLIELDYSISERIDKQKIVQIFIA